jgi:hypothetical protein
MNRTRGSWRKAHGNKPLIAGLLLGMFLLVLAMAQSWALHRLVHPDAGRPGHKCAVTLLTDGQVDAASEDLQVTITPMVAIPSVRPAALLLAAVDYSLLPSRGPPALLT